MKPYRLLLFDMDGTILDTFDFHCAFLAYIFSAIGHPIPPEVLIPHMGVSFQDVLNRLIPLELHEQARLLCQTVPAHLYPYIRPIPDSLSTLSSLRNQGWKTALITNSPAHIIQLFDEQTKFLQGFDLVYPPRLTDVDKISRCEAIFHRFHAAPSEFLYVGDSSHDMELARQLGMDGCLINSPWAWLHHEPSPHAARATFTLSYIRELPALLSTQFFSTHIQDDPAQI